MSFQSILNFFLSPFGIIILIGGFSTLGRVFKSAQEQQAKKRALTEMRRAKHDSLRTGTGSSTPTQPAASSQQASPQTAGWDQKQQLRRNRIEQLRQQRVEQLKKVRQQRTAGQGAPVAQPQPATQPLTRQPKPSRTQIARPQSGPQQTSRSQSTSTTARPPARTPQQSIQRRRSRPARPPVITPQRTTNQSHQPTVSTRSVDRSSIKVGSHSDQHSATGSSGIRAQFRQDMRRAIIASEVLGTPLGLRPPNASPMGNL